MIFDPIYVGSQQAQHKFNPENHEFISSLGGAGEF